MKVLNEQIAKAHADRAEVPELCRLLIGESVIIVGAWADAEARELRIQDFELQGQSFIPIFSDDTQFWNQLGATPYSSQGLAVACQSLISILRGDELLILNPGSATPVQLTKADFVLS